MANQIVFGSSIDFEMVWKSNHDFIDMYNPTVEIYHYEQAEGAKVTSTVQEPFIITQDIDDTLSLAINNSPYLLKIDLDSISNMTNLEPYVVPNTTEKIAIVNGFKRFALSAQELATLINLSSLGFTASSHGGFLVLETNSKGISNSILMEHTLFNSIVGLDETIHYGQDLRTVYDLSPMSMARVAKGTYVVPSISIIEPFKVDERYFVIYKAYIDAGLTNLKISSEDFIVENKVSSKGLSVSFI